MSAGEGVGAAAVLSGAVLAGLAFLTVIVQGELTEDPPPDTSVLDSPDPPPGSYD